LRYLLSGHQEGRILKFFCIGVGNELFSAKKSSKTETEQEVDRKHISMRPIRSRK
jgi:hypothetical protein